jgi:hypothetical protein
MVVHQHQYTVLGALYVDFQHIHTHINRALDSFEGVFWEVTPIGTVSHNDNATFIAIEQLGSDTVCSGLCST